jgi:HSP20 family molecular chaperone IbpA
MKTKLYDKIKLKDERTATIVEILDPEKAYIVDIDLPGPDWETVEIKQEDIQCVI